VPELYHHQKLILLELLTFVQLCVLFSFAHFRQDSYYAKSNRWQFRVVADMDHNSKVKGDDDKDTYWRSFLRDGTLLRDPETGKYTIEWGEKHEIEGYINEKGRAMELSTLINYHNHLYTCCDRTGIGKNEKRQKEER
jgi:hypothetical protein